MKDETVLPRPCNGPAYDGWKIGEWMLKVCEECGKAVTALKLTQKAAIEYGNFVRGLSLDEMNEAKMAKAEAYYDDLLEEKRNLCLELTDIITAATSMLENIGVDETGRQMYQRIINARNARRDGGRRFRREE